MKRVVTLLLLFVSAQSYSQLILDSVESQYLPAYNFLSSDYQVSNVEFIGDSKAYAQFDATNTILGLTRGILLTTGFSEVAFGPNTNGDDGFDLTINGQSPLLDSLSSVNLFDGVTLTFDIVPQVDSLFFRYSFASEEYKGFIGSSFVDVVGIFIEGPGFSEPTNVAIVPNGDPININTIHPALTNTYGTFPAENSQFYVDNPSDINSTDATEIGYNGFTQGTAVNINGLQIDSTYTITISIADALDGLFDSAIFLEACATCNYTLGNQDQSIANFTIAPNPAHDEINVISEGNHRYEIFDLTGKVIFSGVVQGTQKVDISSLEAGTYIMSLDSGAIQRFVKK